MEQKEKAQLKRRRIWAGHPSNRLFCHGEINQKISDVTNFCRTVCTHRNNQWVDDDIILERI